MRTRDQGRPKRAAHPRKLIISLSGGRGSAVSALIAHREGLDFDLVFADTLVEDPDLYRFNDDIARATGHEIIRLCDGRTPWDVYVSDRKMGNNRNANCSRILKTDLIREFCGWSYPEDYPLILGMDLFETERLERARTKWAPRPVRSLLIEYKIAPGSYDAILAEHGICRPHLYDLGFPHNNCGGMCPKAGLRQFATLLEQKRDYYLWCEVQEAQCYDLIPGKKYPFIRDRRGGVTKYLTMEEFRIEYEAGRITPEPYDFGGCGCMIDD